MIYDKKSEQGDAPKFVFIIVHHGDPRVELSVAKGGRQRPSARQEHYSLVAFDIAHKKRIWLDSTGRSVHRSVLETGKLLKLLNTN